MAKAVIKPEQIPSAFNRVVAVIVGIENYQTRSSGVLPTVEYAHDDAKEFADVLSQIYGPEQLECDVLLDQNATCTGLHDKLGYLIKNLEKDDLFVFYYAGHGFHGVGGNRITAFDTNAFNIPGTTLLLSDLLIEPLTRSQCEHALLFVDACASAFQQVVSGRDVVSDLNSQELKAFLESATYCALFLSCSPGEKSYPAMPLKHGVWTSFLLKAMRGEAPEALTKSRHITDSSLRDYLRWEVPRYITRELQVAGSQTPQAIITASNTFAIRYVPAPPALVKGDFTG
ncbi:MAG: caspase family protein [Rhodoplanes sp.]